MNCATPYPDEASAKAAWCAHDQALTRCRACRKTNTMTDLTQVVDELLARLKAQGITIAKCERCGGSCVTDLVYECDECAGNGYVWNRPPEPIKSTPKVIVDNAAPDTTVRVNYWPNKAVEVQINYAP